MELKLEAEKKQLVAFLRGEIDHHAAGRLREEIDNAVTRGNIRELILDFSDIHFMDSSGIGLILGRYKSMCTRGGKLTVRGVSQRQMQVMRMAGLEKLNIFEEDTHESHE